MSARGSDEAQGGELGRRSARPGGVVGEGVRAGARSWLVGGRLNDIETEFEMALFDGRKLKLGRRLEREVSVVRGIARVDDDGRVVAHREYGEGDKNA